MATEFGQSIPRMGYLWVVLSTNVVPDADTLASLARINLNSGTVDVYGWVSPKPQLFLPDRFSYSPNGNAMILADRSQSLYFGPDGMLVEFGPAVWASFCDDGSYVLAGQSFENSRDQVRPTELVATPGGEAIASFGVHGQAVCAG